jgi:hypothetical protein
MVLNFAPFGTDNDFSRPSGTGLPLCTYAGTSCLATIGLSLRDENHSTIEAPRIKLTLMGVASRLWYERNLRRLLFPSSFFHPANCFDPPARTIMPGRPTDTLLAKPERLPAGDFITVIEKAKKIQLTRSDRADTVNQL